VTDTWTGKLNGSIRRKKRHASGAEIAGLPERTKATASVSSGRNDGMKTVVGMRRLTENKPSWCSFRVPEYYWGTKHG